MNELPDNFEAISQPRIFEAFKLQLKKDLEHCGLNADFIGSLLANYDEIFTAVVKDVKKIEGRKENKLSELLYRIDISEGQIAKLMKEKRDVEFSDIIAELIIKRELQKVIIKEMYRKK